jgi:hypothetical protein
MPAFKNFMAKAAVQTTRWPTLTSGQKKTNFKTKKGRLKKAKQ